jgi:hypothetical protein
VIVGAESWLAGMTVGLTTLKFVTWKLSSFGVFSNLSLSHDQTQVQVLCVLCDMMASSKSLKSTDRVSTLKELPETRS